MPHIEAQPENLHGTSPRVGDIVSRLQEFAHRLSGAGEEAAAAIGASDASAAIKGAVQDLSTVIDSLSGAVAGVETKLGSAASSYAETDEGAIPSGKAGP